MLWMTAARHPPVVSASSMAPSGSATTIGSIGRALSGARGSRASVVSPRVGRRLPRTRITTAITMNGSTSVMPRCGNHVQLAAALTQSDWPTPISSPATAATVNEDSSATSAAASAGTIASVIVVGVSDTIGAASTPASPARPEAIAQLPTSVRTGHQPSSDAARSFWATARVTMPNRVKR